MRFVRLLKRLRVAFTVCALFAHGAAHAAVVTAGCANAGVSCSIQELADGGSLRVDDLQFTNWFVDDTSTVPANLDAVNIVGLDANMQRPGVQLDANDALQTAGFDTIDILLGFTVASVSGAFDIAGTLLDLDGFEFGPTNQGGIVALFADIFVGAGQLLGGNVVIADNPTPAVFELSDSTSFAPQSSVSVELLIVLGGDDVNDQTGLDLASLRFAQPRAAVVPEPTTAVLVLLGLIPLVRRTMFA